MIFKTRTNMYTIKTLITALQILEKYSDDESKPIVLGKNDLFIASVEISDVSESDKAKLLTLGFEDVSGHFASNKYNIHTVF